MDNFAITHIHTKKTYFAVFLSMYCPLIHQ